MSKTNPKARDAEKTRERILHAAKKEFAQKGFAGARMDSIARQASANKAMIHYYFDNKEKLYQAMLENEFTTGADIFVELEKKIQGYAPDLLLHIMLYLIVELHKRNEDDEMYQVMAWEIAEGTTQMNRLANKYFIPRIDRLENIIKAGIEKGLFESENPLFTVWSIISLIHFYKMQKGIFNGTEIESRLYSKESRNYFHKYIIERTFHSLSGGGKNIEIPPIPQDVIDEIENAINSYFELRRNLT